MESKKQASAFPRIALAFAIALAIAIGLAFVLCEVILGEAELWVVLGVTTGLVLLGGATGEGLGDAIMFTLILSVVSAIGLTVLPISIFWKQILLCAVVGLASGKLVLSAYSEFFAHHEHVGTSVEANNDDQSASR